MKVALTIAGSDPSGGAGLQADLKTFHQHNVYGMSVVTLLTVQNTQSVDAVEILSPSFIISQLDSLLKDIPPHAAKLGALGASNVMEAVADRASQFDFPLVVDPVMISKHGHALIDASAVQVLRDKIIPMAYLVTPNVREAERLAEMTIDNLPAMELAAAKIAKMGAKNVLVKGSNINEGAVDVLWANGLIHHFRAPRINSRNTHGTGCVLSAAITARLALGNDLLAAVGASKKFIVRAIRSSTSLGNGIGPVNFHADIDFNEMESN